MWKKCVFAAMTGLILWAPASWAQFITLEKPEPYDLLVQGFELSAPATVQVDAVGRWSRDDEDWRSEWRGSREDDALSVYAWILDSETRRPVWIMDAWDTEKVQGNRALRQVQEDVELDAGRYEVYFYSGHGWLNQAEDWDRDDRYKWGKGWSRDARHLREDLAETYVKLSTSGSATTFQPDGAQLGGLVALNQFGDSQLRSAGFELSSRAPLRIYSLIEFTKGAREAADYGWIIDESTREVVWSGVDALSRRAGGSRKNRLIDEEIELDAGRYILYYGTDDSHSYEEFNANPPNDPMNWGITVLPGDGFQASNFSTFDEVRPQDPLVEFTRARDGDFMEQSFRLSSDARLHVYALGEYSYGDREFVDYAWITNAKTGRVEWEMDGRNAVGAGGAEKNRMFDGIIELPAGEYTLYYATDGSHSHDTWNAAEPFDPGAWGVTVWPAQGFDRGQFAEIDERDVARDEGVVIRMVRIRDHERRRERFTLDSDKRVHVYALGEGSDGSMYDYAYIIDDKTGRTIWEMTYRNSVHAGGAHKNRMFDEEILLEAGEYVCYYESDGSHSFEGWNSTKPRDPMNWGITIREVAP